MLFTALYAKQPVNFLSLDALSFHLPVHIGAVLSLSTHVTYTSNFNQDNGQGQGQGSTLASVVVLAEINDVKTGQRKRSNTFHYSFELGGKVSKRVVPGKWSMNCLPSYPTCSCLFFTS